MSLIRRGSVSSETTRRLLRTLRPSSSLCESKKKSKLTTAPRWRDQMPKYKSPNYSPKTAEDQNPDDGRPVLRAGAGMAERAAAAKKERKAKNDAAMGMALRSMPNRK